MREVDSREPPTIVKPLVEAGWERVALKEGQDFKFTDRAGRVVGVQRKTVGDFFNALKRIPGKRITFLEDTLQRLLGSVDIPLLLIEGIMIPTADGFTRDVRGNVYPRKFIAVQLLLSSIESKGVKIITPFPTSPYHTVQTILALERNANKKAHKFLQTPPGQDVWMEILLKIPGIDERKAKSLLFYFGSLEAIFNSLDKLDEAKWVGKKTVEAVKSFMRERP